MQKNESIATLTEKARKYALLALSKERYAHCVSTAQQAAAICRLCGINDYQGYFAGLCHDIAREMSPSLLLSFSARDGRPISEFEKLDPTRFLHGRAAAVLLQEDFGVLDPYILQAVSYHVLGAPFLCPLSLAVYVADKTEPSRKRITQEYTNELFSLPLISMAKKVATEAIEYDKKKKRTTAKDTLDFLAFLQEEQRLDAIA